MTEPSTTTAPYRRIGGDRGAGSTTPSGGGLRRISEEASAPAAAPVSPPAPTGEPDATVAPPKAVRPSRPASTYPAMDEASVGAAARGRRPVIALAVVSVVLLAAVIVLGIAAISHNNTDNLRASALSTARTDGVLVSSYDYRNLTGPGSDWVKVENASTPAFKKNFLSTSVDLGKVLVQYNAVATGKVLNAGLASFSNSRAVVLLFIDQTVNNTVQKQSSTTPLRTELFLVRQGGRWLINDLQVPK